ncbi:15435_t:CDS:2 [Acaulospora colombiana]|uniref:15435_t:CDS:1 n=1 Tax=Acaulospora colombiana TaxID=27376 RepID=A0ACA9LYL1_9GLOM|nr:15435_t:CDS:2 [Acaulospora colombiana]
MSNYGYAGDDDSKVREYLQKQQRFTPLPPVAEKISSPPISSFPEPEFVPSLNASTKEFLENTFRYGRKNEEDFVGRPNEFDDDYRPSLP